MDEVEEICIEEVALEGLDGITLSALWLRLENREPEFNLKLDSFSTEAIWTILASSMELKFYKLPSARELPTIMTKIRHRDPVTGIIQVKQEEYKNPYPVHVISSAKHKVFGSCSTFLTRKEVTAHIRKADGTLKMTLAEVTQKYGDTLVLVASQSTRLRALFGSDSCQTEQLSDIVYVLLEWIGRHRHYGAFQSDSKKDIKIDSKMGFYYRKHLSRLGIITLQSVARQEVPKPFSIVKLLFLKSKTVHQPHSRYDLMSEDVSKYLEATAHWMAAFTDTRAYVLEKHQLVDPDMFRRNIALMKSMGHIEKHTLPHSVATGYRKCRLANKHLEIGVGVIRLLKPFRIDEEDTEEPETSEMNIKDTVLYKGRSQIDQVYQLICMKYFEEGKACTRADLSNYFKLSRNCIRTLMRRLEGVKLVKAEMIDMGKQRASGFIPLMPPKTHTIQESVPSLDESFEATSMDQSEDRTDEQKEMQDRDDKMPSATKMETNFSATRAEKRRKVMLSLLKESKILLGTYLLLKRTRQIESEEGLKTKVDIKSLRRILRKMVKDKEINEYQVQLESARIHNNMITIYTIAGITRDDPQVEALITHEEFIRQGKADSPQRGHTLRKRTVPKKESDGVVASPAKSEKYAATEEEVGEVTGGEEGRNQQFEQLCYLPKMPRLQTTHQYLWYLLHEAKLQTTSSGNSQNKKGSSESEASDVMAEDADQSVMDEASQSSTTVIAQTTGEDTTDCASQGNQNSREDFSRTEPKNSEPLTKDETSQNLVGDADEEAKEEDFEQTGSETQVPSTTDILKNAPGKAPTVYNDTDDWKRFVAPLPSTQKAAPGWFQLGDVFTHLPLSVLCQTCSYRAEGGCIAEYLNDPIKRHYPICDLPYKDKAKLLRSRVTISKFEDNLKYLSKFGLIWFGTHWKNKELRWFYLSKKGILKDTTSSELNYMHVTEKTYPERVYYFTESGEVDKYWYDFKWISLNTPLGLLKDQNGLPVGVPRRESEMVRDLILHWNSIKTTPDNEGVVSGDGRGACGVDSSTFAHLRRNWIWMNVDSRFVGSKHKTNKQKEVEKLEEGGAKRVKRTLDMKREIMMLKGGKMVPVPVAVKHISSEEHKKANKGGKGLKRKKTSPVDTMKKAKIHNLVRTKKSTFFDEKDQMARMRMKTKRALWSSKEDNFILLCCIASAILNEKVTRAFVTWKDIRNIMHEHLEVSKDKSSLAIAKRAANIFHYPQTNVNYATCLTEIREDEELINGFMSRKDDYTNPAVCVEEYQEFLERLIDKYKKQASGNITWLTDLSYSDLQSKYKVVVATNIRETKRHKRVRKESLDTKSDVQKAVVQSLIMGALHTQSYKGYSPSVMFEIFNQFDETLLHDAFMYLREVSICSRSRNIRELGLPLLKRVLPHVPMSYQLSQGYYKFFVSKISKETLLSAAEFYTKVLEAKDDLVRIPMDPSGEICAVTLVTLVMGQGKLEVTIPDQIIHFDKNAVQDGKFKRLGKRRRLEDGESEEDEEDEDEEDDDEEDDEDDDDEQLDGGETELLRLLSQTQAELQRYDNLPEVSKRDDDGGSTLEAILERGDVELKIDENVGKSETVQPAQIVKEVIEAKEQSSVPSSSSKAIQGKEAAKGKQIFQKDGERILKGEDVVAHFQLPSSQMSTGNNLLLLRGHFKRQLSSADTISMKDDLLINSCDLTLRMYRSSQEKQAERVQDLQKSGSLLEFLESEKYVSGRFMPFRQHHPTTVSSVKLDNWLKPTVVQNRETTWQSFKLHCQSLSKFQDQLEDLEQVYNFIQKSDLLGVTVKEVKNEFPNWSRFMKQASILIQEEMVLEAGSMQLRLVTIENAFPWVIRATLKGKCEVEADSLMHDGLVGFPLIGRDLQILQRTGQSSDDHPDKEKQKGEVRAEQDKHRDITTVVADGHPQDSREKPGKVRPDSSGMTSGAPVEDELDTTGSSTGSEQVTMETDDATVKSGSQKKHIDIIYRQFYRIDGTVNYTQMQSLFTRLANFVIENPGYKEEDIVLYLEPIIHAVECIELLQKLTEFGCITRHVHQHRKYYSPFDKKGRLHSYAYYMPTIDCLNRLSLLTSALQKDV